MEGLLSTGPTPFSLYALLSKSLLCFFVFVFVFCIGFFKKKIIVYLRITLILEKPLDGMAFRELRTAASSVLNFFCGEDGKSVDFGSDLEPAFWSYPVEVVFLNMSKDAIIGKHGDVSHITLGDVMPWHLAKQPGLNPRDTVQLMSKSKHKAYLVFVVELALVKCS